MARGDRDRPDGLHDDGDDGDELYFKIGESAQLVGVEPHVLRYWEGEFGLRPRRSPSGQRMYRRDDIARFVRIRRLLHEEGFTIAGARKALQEAEDGEAGSGSGVDPARVAQALDRVREARQRIAAMRARLGVGEEKPES